MKRGQPRRGEKTAKNLGVSVAGEIEAGLASIAQRQGWTKSYLTEQILRNYLGYSADYSWTNLLLIRRDLLEEGKMNGSESIRDWQKISLTLSRWGNLLESQGTLDVALQIYIEAFHVDLEHNNCLDLSNLGRIIKTMGAPQFQLIWQQATGSQCPDKVLAAICVAAEQQSLGKDFS